MNLVQDPVDIEERSSHVMNSSLCIFQTILKTSFGQEEHQDHGAVKEYYKGLQTSHKIIKNRSRHKKSRWSVDFFAWHQGQRSQTACLPKRVKMGRHSQ